MRRWTPLALLLCSALALGAAQPPTPPKPNKPSLPSGHPGAPVASTWPKAKPADVASIDAIVAAFYAATSGAPGQAREWDRYRSLFAPDARLVAARPGAEGAASAMFLTVGNFVDANRNYFEKGGFFDKEVARRTETFGNMAQVWSTFESRHKADEPQPYVRGINSIQLLKDGDRWWIVNVFWDLERDDSTIPAKYLPDAPK